jgi:uncharacterized protein (TIGR03000 family)
MIEAMKRSTILLTFFACFDVGSITALAADGTTTPFGQRLWLDATGEHVTEAEFVAFDGDGVRLRRENGRALRVPLSRLSDDDRAYLRRFCEGHEATVPTWQALFGGPGDGLRGEYYTDTSFEQLGQVRSDGQIDMVYGQNQPPYQGGREIKPRDGWYENFAVRWSGRIVPRFTEDYTFHVTADDGVLLWVDDRLLVNAWDFKGVVEYRGQASLTAGQPVRVKLLYYNGPFGGSIKWEWSSSSQRKEPVPRDRMFPPADDEAPPFAPAPSLAGQIETHTIDLPAKVKCAPRGGWGVPDALLLFPLAAGGGRLGWNDIDGTAHVTTLGPEWRVTGSDTTLPKFDLRGLHVHADGALGLLGAELPDRMVLIRRSVAGKQEFRTVLTGGKGRLLKERYLDDLWCFSGRLAASDKEYAAHFGHVWQTDPDVAHQGGYFATVDFKGKKGIEHSWTVSHSLDQQLIRHRDSFLTLSLGDVYPKGLWFQNRTLNLGRVIFPPPHDREKWRADTARLGSLCPAGRHTAIVLLSKDSSTRDMVYLLVGDDLQVLRSRTLLDSRNIDEQAVRLAPFGENLLLAWRDGDHGAKVALIDFAGRFLNEPIAVDATLPTRDELIHFPNGDVGWLTAENGQPRVQLVRIVNPAPTLVSSPAELIVWLPAGAELEAQGVAIGPRRPVRRLRSPPLTPGKPFSYALKATWPEAGRTRTEERRVPVAAGERIEIEFGPPRPIADDLSAAERTILELTNAQRDLADLPPLRPHPQLCAAARGHSANMAKQSMLNHTLDEVDFSQRITAAGYRAGEAGENIAQAPSPNAAMEMWMKSDGHKANILGSGYREIGIGVGRGADGRLYYTQVFAAPGAE